MAAHYPDTILAAMLDVALADINDGASTPGYLEFRSGSMPATIEDARTGTVRSTCPLVDETQDAFGATATTPPLTATGYTSGGIFASDASIATTGTVGYWTLYDYTDAARLQGTYGTSGTDIIGDSATFTSGGTVTVESLDVTISEG